MVKRSRWLLAVGLLLGALVACQSATPEATANPTVSPSATAVPKATATPVPSTPTRAPVAVSTPTRETGSKPQPTPTYPWQIPGIGAGDWGKGNPDAGLVVV